jgi:hypothetical protein
MARPPTTSDVQCTPSHTRLQATRAMADHAPPASAHQSRRGQHVAAGIREACARHQPRPRRPGAANQVLDQPLDGRARGDRDQHDQRQRAAAAGGDEDAYRAGAEDDRGRTEPGDPERQPVHQRAPQCDAGVGDGSVPDQQRTVAHAGQRREQAGEHQRRGHKPGPPLTDPAEGHRRRPVQVGPRVGCGRHRGARAGSAGRANDGRAGGTWGHGVLRRQGEGQRISPAR